MNTAALFDEVVVIDSDSTDDSYAVATGAGAIVHRVADIRPDLGWCRAREAMWKSLFVTTGDLLFFMEAAACTAIRRCAISVRWPPRSWRCSALVRP